MQYQAVSEDLWIQHLRTNKVEELTLGKGGIEEERLENYIVSGLIDFDDVSYEDHADLLYDLATQTIQHLRKNLSEENARKVLQYHQKQISRFIHAQMQDHYWEKAAGYEIKISKGVTELKESAYAKGATENALDYRQAPADKSNMAKYLFGGFQRCLYSVQKFQSDSERKMAVILERESIKWFKPAKGQFQLFYQAGSDHLEYQPDFVAETDSVVYMIEPKANNAMEDADVIAKRDVAVSWCAHATANAAKHGGKPWRYLLIPHDAIAENMTLEGLAKQYTESFKQLIGLWKGRGTTEELMNDLRGED
jgi:type III restriction enzyme